MRPVDPRHFPLFPLDPIIRSSALAVSANGAVVIGEYATNLDEGAFVWGSHTGMIDLLTHNPSWENAKARAVSANGKVIVGRATNSISGVQHAVRWTETSHGYWLLQPVAWAAEHPDDIGDGNLEHRYKSGYVDVLDVSDDGNTMLVRVAETDKVLMWVRVPV